MNICIKTCQLIIETLENLYGYSGEFNQGVESCVDAIKNIIPKSSNYKIYADGACSGNPGPGGWGYVILCNDAKVDENSDYDPGTTNNQMELMSAITALDWLFVNGSEGDTAEIIIDSQYVIKGITEWINTWKKNNWKTSSKNSVKNEFLWKELDQILILVKENGIKLKWTWTKGHSKDKWNKYVDNLATRAVHNDSLMIPENCIVSYIGYRFNTCDIKIEFYDNSQYDILRIKASDLTPNLIINILSVLSKNKHFLNKYHMRSFISELKYLNRYPQEAELFIKLL